MAEGSQIEFRYSDEAGWALRELSESFGIAHPDSTIELAQFVGRNMRNPEQINFFRALSEALIANLKELDEPNVAQD